MFPPSSNLILSLSTKSEIRLCKQIIILPQQNLKRGVKRKYYANVKKNINKMPTIFILLPGNKKLIVNVTKWSKFCNTISINADWRPYNVNSPICTLFSPFRLDIVPVFGPLPQFGANCKLCMFSKEEHHKELNWFFNSRSCLSSTALKVRGRDGRKSDYQKIKYFLKNTYIKGYTFMHEFYISWISLKVVSLIHFVE